jgi:hypothetical protein
MRRHCCARWMALSSNDFFLLKVSVPGIEVHGGAGPLAIVAKTSSLLVSATSWQCSAAQYGSSRTTL